MLTLALALSLASPKLVVAYVPNSIDLAKFADTVDFSKLTHVIVASENPINADGEISFNAADDAVVAKAKAAGVRVLVSIGGPSMDKDLVARYADLISEEKRKGFIRKLSQFVQKHGFQGLDVNLDGAAIGKDYAPFLAALGDNLYNRGWLFSLAVSQARDGDKLPKTAFENADIVSVKAFDALGSWDAAHPGQHAPLDLAKSSVAYYLGLGVPKSKLVLGIPFYGYGFGTALRKESYPFSEIVAKYPGSAGKDQIGDTIWYNGIPTVQAKAKLIVEQGLAGAMVWSLDSDATGDNSLLAALYGALRS